MPHPFNPRTIALEPAQTHLIEASAGTGKTYGIAALFTRLILQGSAIERIIVVTFTEAAAAELKTRLRKWLNYALKHLQQPDHITDTNFPPIIPLLIEDARQQHDPAMLIQRLQVALHAFDTAAIYTIHGFCLRVLNDQALRCGMPFDIQIGAIDPAILLRGVQDFWRQHIANDRELAPLVLEHKLTPQNLLAKMQPFGQQPLLQRRLPDPSPLAALRQQRDHAWQQLHRQLTEIETAFWQLRPKLNGNKYHEKNHRILFAQLHTFRLPEDSKQLLLFQKDKNYAANFHIDKLKENHKKGFEPDANEVAQLLPLQHFIVAQQQYQQAQNTALIRLELQILNVIDAQIETEKKRHNTINFNDLLLEVYQALHHSPHRTALARAMAEQCDAVLIDEFQDTDPLQYAIFHTAFIQHGLPVFLVGDPKQAIYAFRGADIQAYLAAARDIADDARHSLTVNYRSHQGVVAAVAALFAREQPFVLPDIPYVPIQAHRNESGLEGHGAAFHIRWLNDPDAASETKDTLNKRAADYCARDIADLLNRAQSGYLKLNQQAVQAQDIAVLVRTHKQAQRIRRALEQRGIHSVLLQKQSVFHTPPARAIAALLRFFLEPNRTELLRFVLTGVLYRFDAAQLDAFNRQADQIDRWTQWAHQAAQTWQRDGIFTALTRFAAQSELESRLLRHRDERSLTDFWHLAELLAHQAFAHATPQALLTWLQDKMQSADKNNQQDTQLRLESDDNRVKIITMHAAKGLEYPIVFCPFVWDTSQTPKADWYTVRRNGENWLLPAHELTETEQNQLHTEQLGEDLRLLYVALTRARDSLTLYVAAQDKSTPHNALAYLLAPSEIHAADHPTYWENQKKQLFETYKHALQQQLAHLTDIQWHTTPPPPNPYRDTHHDARDYHAIAHPARHWQTLQQSSFTALSRNAVATSHPTHRLPEAAAALSDNRLAEADTGRRALLAFPRGTQAGICLHRILELADFHQNAAAQSDMIERVLQTHGYRDTSHTLAAHTLLDAVRHCPLTAHTRLCDLPIRQQTAEWGFMLHAHQFSRRRLLDWFAQQNHIPAHAADQRHQLDFPTLNGFLNGFIDHLAQDENGQIIITDFKSNHLGDHASDYHFDAMSRAVSQHQYALQALIYAIAAARHFRRHRPLPETIAIRYLFVRGLNPHGDEGIWRWDIPTASLQTWLD